jgi:hypothetical protein
VNDERIENPDALLSAEQFQNNLALLRRGKQVAVLVIEK